MIPDNIPFKNNNLKEINVIPKNLNKNSVLSEKQNKKRTLIPEVPENEGNSNKKIKIINDNVNFISQYLETQDNFESRALKSMESRQARILDAKYEKADLKATVQSATHLNKEQQNELYKVLVEFEQLFDGTLAKWNTSPVDIELNPNAKPIYSRPYSIAYCHEELMKKEIQRLCDIGVLRRINNSQWGAPTFAQPKKNKTIRVLTDFRQLNKQIIRKPYPIPKINEMLLKLEGFQYATSLDLNMGYYHIELTPNARRICTIVLPWGKYEYCRLPMGLCNSPDIFQEKMDELFHGFKEVRAYIDDILVLTKGSWPEHITILRRVLTKMKKANLRINAKKSFFGREC